MRVLVAGLGIVGLGWLAGEVEAPSAARSIRVTPDRSGMQYALQAEDVRLADIAAALGRATGCVVEIPETLGQRRLTLDLEARPIERLLLVLARRTDARVTQWYRLEPAPPGAPRRAGSRVLASVPITLELPRPVELTDALQYLAIRVEVADGVAGRVRVAAARTPLAQVLDQIAGQVGAVWHTVIRLEAHRPVDDAAAAEERGRFFYTFLTALPSPERQEELAADLARLERLPAEQRAPEVRRMEQDIQDMAALVRGAPGEHRAPVLARVQAIQNDYWTVLSHLPPDRQATVQPLFRALRDLSQRLAEIR